jgi:hypothetical protein
MRTWLEENFRRNALEKGASTPLASLLLPLPLPFLPGRETHPSTRALDCEHPTQDSDTPSFVKKADDMTTGTDIVANERSGKDILDENLWPGFDKFKVVQVRFVHTGARDTP